MSMASDLLESIEPPDRASVQIAYGYVTTVTGSSLSVLVRGGVAEGVRMTTGCSGAKVGQRAVLIGSPPVWTAIGILA